MSAIAPWSVPGYVVEDLIGFGSAAQVWRAHESASRRPVALKRIATPDADSRHAARSEAGLLSGLDHEHLVPLLATIDGDGEVVLALELLEGGSLADVLQARGRLTPGEVVTALAPVAAAAAYVHSEGHVHGDITPGNILFTAAGKPLLSDLGVARMTGDRSPSRTTPAYVDPHVARGVAPSPGSDVFMLGAVAYHALVGEPIWRGATPSETFAHARHGSVVDVVDRLLGVPDAMARLISAALSMTAHERPTAAVFALDLQGSAAPVAVEVSAGRERMGATRRLAPPTVNADDDLDTARPGFARPQHLHLRAPSELDTHVADAVRMTLTVPGEAARPRRPRRPRRWIWAVTAAALLALSAAIGAGVLRAAPTSSARSGQPPPAPPVGPSGGPPPVSSPSTSQPATSTPVPDALSDLRRLDALRARAFATRDAALLTGIYSDAALAAADRAELARLVHPGCSATGVSTTFSEVSQVRTARGVSITVIATLAPSSRVCAGGVPSRVAGAGPVTLVVELTGPPGARTIAAQRMKA